MPQREFETGIKPPRFVKLDSIKDLGRLVCSLERAPLPIFHFKGPEGGRMAVQIDFFKGRPIFYYADSKDFKQYLGYKNSDSIEEIVLTDNASNPTFKYSPIISIMQLPTIFKKGLVEKKPCTDKFLSIQVGDLSSLAKICAYKMMFEEPALPVFAFQFKSNWILGTFTRMDEYEDGSLFFYLPVTNLENHNFIKYSFLKSSEVLTTNKVGEHGYLFIKIIRLNDIHPLVDTSSMKIIKNN